MTLVRLPPAMDTLHRKLQRFCLEAEAYFARLPCPTLSDMSLKELSITRGAPLDLDATGKLDSPSEPCFFRPRPDTPEFGFAVADVHLASPESWRFCPETHHRLSCPHILMCWYKRVLSFAAPVVPSEDRTWSTYNTMCDTPGHTLPEYEGSRDHKDFYGRLPDDKSPYWAGDTVLFAKCRPHIGCMLADSTIPNLDEVLRSEVLTALYLIRHHIEHGRYPGHTIPVIVYTISHTNTARITQFHFNGSELIFRQSDLLNIGSPNVVHVMKNAILLLRWMKCEPISQTEMEGLKT